MKTIDSIMVDDELCKACGICSDLCPRSVFDVDKAGRPLVARLDDCSGCLFCEWHCPEFAVRVWVAGDAPKAPPHAVGVGAGAAEVS